MLLLLLLLSILTAFTVNKVFECSVQGMGWGKRKKKNDDFESVRMNGDNACSVNNRDAGDCTHAELSPMS